MLLASLFERDWKCSVSGGLLSTLCVTDD